MTVGRDRRSGGGGIGPDRGSARRGTGAARSAAGFSLIEMLVALVIAGVAVAGLVQVLTEQDRFYGSLDDRSFTSRSVRGISDMLYRELRSASPSDVGSASASSVTVFQDILRGVVCTSQNPKPVYVYRWPLSPGVDPGTSGAAYRDVENRTTVYRTNWSPALDTTTAARTSARSACAGTGAPAGAPLEDFLEMSWSSSPGPPPAGSVVRVFGRVTYELQASSFGEGRALWKHGVADSVELIGPFTSDSKFRYRLAGGTTTSNPGPSADIRAIIFDGRVREARGSRDTLRRELDLDVTLRNQ